MKQTILSKTSTQSPSKTNIHQGSTGNLDKNSSLQNFGGGGSMHNEDLNTSAQERHYKR